MNLPQGGDEVGREELGEGHELPVQDKETVRAGGDALGQGTARRPRRRVTKVEAVSYTHLTLPTIYSV